MQAIRGLVRRDSLTLVLGLGIAYVLLTGLLPAWWDQHLLSERRAEVVQDLQRLEPQLQGLQEWADGVEQDPLLRQRLAESFLLSPDVPGYRVVNESDVSTKGRSKSP
ncbi:MAG: hypothetical protein ACT4PU_00835 [Planctomycetota bacterium]